MCISNPPCDTSKELKQSEITGPIQGYGNANYGGDEDWKSISGYFLILAGTAVSWQAKKRTTVAQSMVEGEYAAMEYVAKELIWLQHLLRDLGMSKCNLKTLFCNNEGAIILTKNPTHHAKMKHIDVQLHVIQDHVEKGTIEALERICLQIL